MYRRLGGLVAAAGLMLCVCAVNAPPAAAAPPLPKAYVLVDVDTGAVIAQQDAHTLRPPASTIKLLTGLIAVQHLGPADLIPISPTAEGMPARKINVKASQQWTYDSMKYSMMMVSANDAAVALAEKIGGGTLDGYVDVANKTAARLGLTDLPILNDPAGLDDEFANKGGDRISARDLAIVARAAMAEPDLMGIINTRSYNFVGGDGLNHSLTNHNLFLDLYSGANGLKTGTTDLAGHTFVGSATRNGRTMLAVVFDAVDSYGSAGALLDQGFNTPVVAEAAFDHLPNVEAEASVPATTTIPVPAVVSSHSKHDSLIDSPVFAFFVLIVGLLPLIALRRRVVVRALRQRARHRDEEEWARELVFAGRPEFTPTYDYEADLGEYEYAEYD